MDDTKNEGLEECKQVDLPVWRMTNLEVLEQGFWMPGAFCLAAQSKSKTQLQEVCTVSSIVLLLTLMEHNMLYKCNFTLSNTKENISSS